MAEPTIDEDELIRLLRTLPEGWTYRELAGLLTEHNTRRGEPAVVTAPAVTMRVNRMVDRGVIAGIGVWVPLKRKTLVRQLTENTGRNIHPAHYMDADLLWLRQLSRIRDGLRPGANGDRDPEVEAANALAFESRLRRERVVVDLDEEGVPYRRPAYGSELDCEHELIDVIAQPRPVADAGKITVLPRRGRGGKTQAG